MHAKQVKTRVWINFRKRSFIHHYIIVFIDASVCMCVVIIFKSNITVIIFIVLSLL